MTNHSKLTESIKINRLQRLIGQRMSLSKQTKPCFYLKSQADVTELMAMRHKLKKAIGTKITTNAFYIEAAARAVKKFPLTAGLIENNKIKIAKQINIGFAVNTSVGLVVPVIKNADQKTLADIAKSEKTLTDSARSNRLTPDELTGETMAISNLGAYDIDCFLGIVPPQTSVILAIGKSTPAAAVFENAPAVRRIVNLSLAVDRRIIDEIYAAKFMRFIISQLENPSHLADN